MCLYVYIFAQCGTFQLILMEVKCAQSKENCNTNLEACKDKQGVSSLLSTRHAFMLINLLQEKNPISRESHCQTIKSQHTILKLIENDGKTSISSSTNFGSIKAASKGASQSVSFPVSNQVQSVQTEDWIYLCSIKGEWWEVFFFCCWQKRKYCDCYKIKEKIFKDVLNLKEMTLTHRDTLEKIMAI